MQGVKTSWPASTARPYVFKAPVIEPAKNIEPPAEPGSAKARARSRAKRKRAKVARRKNRR